MILILISTVMIINNDQNKNITILFDINSYYWT